MVCATILGTQLATIYHNLHICQLVISLHHLHMGHIVCPWTFWCVLCQKSNVLYSWNVFQFHVWNSFGHNWRHLAPPHTFRSHNRQIQFQSESLINQSLLWTYIRGQRVYFGKCPRFGRPVSLSCVYTLLVKINSLSKF